MVYSILSGYTWNHKDSTSKNEERAAADFGLDRVMLEDNTVVEANVEEPMKAKAGLRKPKTMEAAGVSKGGQLVQAAMEVKLGKVKDRSGKANAGTFRTVLAVNIMKILRKNRKDSREIAGKFLACFRTCLKFFLQKNRIIVTLNT